MPDPAAHTCSKTFRGSPCRFVHGNSRRFTIWYRAYQFDHIFLANANDPLLDTWPTLHEQERGRAR